MYLTGCSQEDHRKMRKLRKPCWPLLGGKQQHQERHKEPTTFSTGQPKELRAATNAAQVCTMEKLGLAFYAKQILNI
jgi:hypothetical protein